MGLEKVGTSKKTNKTNKDYWERELLETQGREKDNICTRVIIYVQQHVQDLIEGCRYSFE